MVTHGVSLKVKTKSGDGKKFRD